MGMLHRIKAAPSRALVGTLVVALMLAGTRWGSYIGYAPLFLTDMLIAAAIANRILVGSGGKECPGDSQTGRAAPTVLFSLFFIYVLLRGILSADILTMAWIRDLMPFLYGILAFMSAASFARSTENERTQTMKWLWRALIFHLSWVSIVVLAKVPPAFFPNMPASDVPLLSTRPDMDMAVLSVTAALLLRRLVRGECNKFWGTIGLLLSIVATASMHSRAGLIALAVAMTISFGVTYSASKKRSGRRTMMVLSVPVLLSIALVALSHTTPGERLIASATSTSTGSLNEQSARGTERARELTWAGVIDWTFESTARTTVGSGFGNDFLSQSGVIQFLEGTEYKSVRSPHNWLVGILARTGVIGLGLIVLVILGAGLVITRNRRRIGDSELLTMASVSVLALLPVGLFGVVLESPFGAIPFWWFLGIIMTMHGMVDERHVHGPVLAAGQYARLQKVG